MGLLQRISLGSTMVIEGACAVMARMMMAVTEATEYEEASRTG